VEVAALVLEYLKVAFSYPVVIGGVSVWFVRKYHEEIKRFLSRVRTLEGPGGIKIAAPESQSERLALQPLELDATLPAATGPVPSPSPLPPSNAEIAAHQATEGAREAALIWQFRFFNLLLVRRTQLVLDRLETSERLGTPTTIELFDALLSFVPVQERKATFQVLRDYGLIELGANNVITVTPLGRRYLAWRGPMPVPPAPALPESTPSPASAPLPPLSREGLADLVHGDAPPAFVNPGNRTTE
jgi:hypothetical protein